MDKEYIVCASYFHTYFLIQLQCNINCKYFLDYYLFTYSIYINLRSGYIIENIELIQRGKTYVVIFINSIEIMQYKKMCKM